MSSKTKQSQTYKTVCATCKKEIEVPFKPDPTRPQQYCRDCWQKEGRK